MRAHGICHSRIFEIRREKGGITYTFELMVSHGSLILGVSVLTIVYNSAPCRVPHHSLICSVDIGGCSRISEHNHPKHP